MLKRVGTEARAHWRENEGILDVMGMGDRGPGGSDEG